VYDPRGSVSSTRTMVKWGVGKPLATINQRRNDEPPHISAVPGVL
jgi:hypothetical protein